MKSRTLAGIALVAFALTLFVGCAEEKLTYQRWQTLHDGQSPVAVKQCLGEPWQKLSDRWIYEDTDRDVSARVYWNEEGTKVISKQWYDPENGWQGKNPDELGEGSTGGSTTGSGSNQQTID